MHEPGNEAMGESDEEWGERNGGKEKSGGKGGERGRKGGEGKRRVIKVR